MALQRKNRAPVGVKAPFPGVIEPVLAEQVDRVPRAAADVPISITEHALRHFRGHARVAVSSASFGFKRASLRS